MHIIQLLAGSALGLIGGSVGTKVMKPVAMKLYELEQEDRVRPGPPYSHRRLEDSRLPRALAHLLHLTKRITVGGEITQKASRRDANFMRKSHN